MFGMGAGNAARIRQLEAEVSSLRDQLDGEHAMRKYEVAERDAQIRRLMTNGGGWSIPEVLYDALRFLDTKTPNTYIYFQDTLAKIPPFKIVDLKLRKQNSKNVPEGWAVEKGGVVVLYDGEMIGKFTPEEVKSLGLVTSKTYRGFVVPPCIDHEEGYRLNDKFVPKMFV